MVANPSNIAGETPVDEETPFLEALCAQPHDDDLRQVYADWLEERGDPRGELLRIESKLTRLPAKGRQVRRLLARLRALRSTVDPAWLARVDNTAVEGCSTFAFECPKQWEQLKQTADPFTRVCESCKKKVFYCGTLELAQRHADRGHCVAVDSRLTRRPADLHLDPLRDPQHSLMVLGMPAPPAPRYRPGQRVTLFSGPYAGARGEIQSLHLSQLRATVVIAFNGQSISVEVAFDDLELEDSRHRSR